MCVTSYVMTWGTEWVQPYTTPSPFLPSAPPAQPFVWPAPAPPNDLAERIKKLEDLVERHRNPVAPFTQAMADFLGDTMKEAKRYDDETGQPDCENDNKKRTLQELADQLKVKISFE